MELILPHASSKPDAVTAQLDRLQAARLQPFDARTLAFLAAFAERILRDTGLRSAPELVALAYWFRPAAIEILQQRYRQLAEHGLLRPRGVAFHIAPANVDAVFVYSWFLSLLCGNRNIVRISKRENPNRTALLALLGEVMARPEHADIAAANAVLAYARDDGITTDLSARCHLRVVWGGDTTVRHVRSLPLPPLATELVFPNRSAWALLDAQTVCEAGEDALKQAASAFHNDTFWFGQQACSSPRAVLWIGSTERVEAARARFWPALDAELARRGAQDEAAQLAARLVTAHQAATEAELTLASALSDWPLRLMTDSFSPALRAHHCGYGLLYEIQRDRLDDSAGLFVAEDQTIAYWGFAREALAAWVGRLPDRAIDRIVPLGQALRFADRWDGHDLLLAFSRQVVIE
ncbi:MAG: hypothetical protein IPO35_04905 [Uliginosibacterium sp.]|nr:hypothetical protein [Uliginosibacterium sp.]